jgi:hypothetical protein
VASERDIVKMRDLLGRVTVAYNSLIRAKTDLMGMEHMRKLILEKFPQSIVVNLVKTHGKMGIEKLLDEIRKTTITLEDLYGESNQKFDFNSHKKFMRKNDIKIYRNTGPSRTVPGDQACLFCDQNHRSFWCKSPLSVMERKKIAMAKGACFLCLKKGHTAEQCRAAYRCACGGRHSMILCDAMGKGTTQTKVEAKWIDPHSPGSRTQVFMDFVEDPLIPPILVNCRIKGWLSEGVFDSGANINLLSDDLVLAYNIKVFPMHMEFETSAGKAVSSKACIVPLQIGVVSRPVKFIITEELKNIVLLGRGVIVDFSLTLSKNLAVFQELNTDQISVSKSGDQKNSTSFMCSTKMINQSSLLCSQENLTEEMKTKIKNLVNKFKGIFSENGTVGRITTEQCKIKLTNETPIVCRPYPCSRIDQEMIDEQVMKLLDTGLITTSNSPFSFPVVLVDKKDDGKKTRLCIDYRKLNAVTETEHFPMPRMVDIEDKLLGATWFSTLDVSSGFHHIEISQEDRYKTSFVTMNEQYQWNVMPFGLKNAPVVFQRIFYHLLKKHDLLKYAHNYIDDVIIYSPDFETHLNHLEKVFQAMTDENVKLKYSKCQLAMSSVTYLGHEIKKNEIKPLFSNIRAIMQASPPKNVKTLRGFLGKINYYNRFIPNRAKLLDPLYNLLKKKNEFKWNENAQAAFDQIKVILTSRPTLKIFDPELETILYTDASVVGIGAVLKQIQPGSDKEELPVGYFSRRLLDYQRNYSTTELECLAIIESIEYWHCYLYGKEFTVMTDHQPLQGVIKVKKPKTRLFNWAMRLNQYNVRIRYRPGGLNQEADFLSRHPIEELLQQNPEAQVMFLNIPETLPSLPQDQLIDYAVSKDFLPGPNGDVSNISPAT